MTHLSYNNNITRLLVLKDKKHQPWLLYAQVTPTSSDTTNTSYTDRDRIMKTRGGRKEVKGGGGAGYPERRRHCQVAGGKDQGAQLTGSGGALDFHLSRKSTQHRHQNRTMPIFRGELRKEKSGTQRCRGTCNGITPQGPTETRVQDEGGKGGTNRHGKRIRRRHAERGEETSNGGWQAAGAGDVDVQVGGSLHR